MAYQKTLLSLLILFPLGNTIDTISPSQFLRDGQTLVSSGQNFALGFFSPGRSKNRFVGIWYNKIPKKTVVWVANRGNPVSDFSGNLTISNGNLVLVDGRNHQLWSTNLSTVTNHSSATLTDSGNLALRDDHQTVLWESFDFPTNTLLPGMKFGLDLRTGLNRYLSSWKSPDDPAHGEFTFGIDTRGMSQFFLMKGSDPIWRSGPWNNLKFSGAAGSNIQYAINISSVVDDGDENDFMYRNINSSLTSNFLLDVSGVIQMLIWNDDSRQWGLMWVGPADSCDRYGHCGANGLCDPSLLFGCACLKGFEPKTPRDLKLRDWSDGCMRRKPLYCDGKGDGFFLMKNVKLPDTSSARVERGLRLDVCEEECLKNCSCTAYADISGERSGCVMWFGDLMDIRVFPEDGQDLYTRLTASELDESSRRFFRIKMAVLVVPWVAVALIMYGYISWRKAKRHAAKKRSNIVLMKSDLEWNNDESDLRLYDLSVIKAATNNFSKANMLGKGGFGLVYKGKLLNGQEIAIKKLSENSRQGAEEFKNEILLIAKLQHKNLVRLLGYCISEQEKMLIYEFMPNKSLDTFIFGLEAMERRFNSRASRFINQRYLLPKRSFEMHSSWTLMCAEKYGR